MVQLFLHKWSWHPLVFIRVWSLLICVTVYKNPSCGEIQTFSDICSKNYMLPWTEMCFSFVWFEGFSILNSGYIQKGKQKSAFKKIHSDFRGHASWTRPCSDLWSTFTLMRKLHYIARFRQLFFNHQVHSFYPIWSLQKNSKGKIKL